MADVDRRPRTGEGSGPPGELRSILDAACAQERCSAKDLTVLATQNDPFRVDTPARHRDGEWLAVQAAEHGLGDRRIHLRGLHYTLLDVEKPDGKAYANTDPDWQWLQGDAGKAARWLGYLPFDQIVDARNAAPVVRTFKPVEPWAYVSIGVHVEIPKAEGIKPWVGVMGFAGAQPYKLVLFGEKTSLEEVLAPIAARHQADLYLPTGEISDTLLYGMARVGAEDGRHMVVLTLSDCDPAGWQMPISIARKLQAFRAFEFPDLSFEVRPVALTPDQVRERGLPSTPLKATERRADKWQEAMGVEQTEIDALATLRPELLERIVSDALEPFYDRGLDRRVRVAHRAWQERAQAAVDEQLDPDRLEQLRAEAAGRLEELRTEIDAINEALRSEAGGQFDLPDPVVPEPEITTEADGNPLIHSAWGYAEQSRRLIVHKAYRNRDD